MKHHQAIRSAIGLALSAIAVAALAQDHDHHAAAAMPQTDEAMVAARLASFPKPPSPNYGPERGSIVFEDTDPGETIGGTLTMRPAVDADGKPLDGAAAGITMYMIHWGLEVGVPGVADDAGAGDLGGDCKGFRDTGHVVMAPVGEPGKTMSWTIPQGTKIPANAVYFVGHTLYGPIHNLAKCTQTPIRNWVTS